MYEMKIQMQLVLQFFQHENANAKYPKKLVGVSVSIEKMTWLRENLGDYFECDMNTACPEENPAEGN